MFVAFAGLSVGADDTPSFHLLLTAALWLHSYMAANKSTSEITDAIRATGVKVTPGRVRVLELLSG
ncbi:MAG: hypothetical protein KA388_10725, partial [Rhodocyclaceae bacterium]|nr:hypothetical protein [Rhodocyclaceae bacterium]